ncbi:unnamed protein product [Ilex paraguariensis]|uniref:Uncharacterized protein n=1 Tax=Ilex paraguariensis TaxID=185542 RepID=A0ABC8SGH3_9AQUA
MEGGVNAVGGAHGAGVEGGYIVGSSVEGVMGMGSIGDDEGGMGNFLGTNQSQGGAHGELGGTSGNGLCILVNGGYLDALGNASRGSGTLGNSRKHVDNHLDERIIKEGYSRYWKRQKAS